MNTGVHSTNMNTGVHGTKMDILKLFLSIVALSVSGIDGQFASFPPNSQNTQNQNFPPRLNAGGSQPFLPQQVQLQGGQPDTPNISQLTDRQKLAFLQGNSLNNQGFRGLRPAFQQPGTFSTQQNQFPERVRQNQQVGQSSQFGRTSPEQSQFISQQNTLQNFPQQPQQFAQHPLAQSQQFAQQPLAQSQPHIPQPSPSHPEQFLNQLNEQQKQKFLSQFEQLTQEQQTYAYNKFLSTPAEVQLFAINQFLSLDPQVLAVSLQEEIRKEQALVQGEQQFQQPTQQGLQQPIAPQQVQQSLAPRPLGVGQRFAPRTQGVQQSFAQRPQGVQQSSAQRPQEVQQDFAQRPQGVQQSFAPRPQGLPGVQPSQLGAQAAQPSAADQLALRKQQEALQQIIDLQNSINFPNST